MLTSAFSTDKLTLEKRLEVSHHTRESTEESLKNEINSVLEVIRVSAFLTANSVTMQYCYHAILSPYATLLPCNTVTMQYCHCMQHCHHATLSLYYTVIMQHCHYTILSLYAIQYCHHTILPLYMLLSPYNTATMYNDVTMQ